MKKIINTICITIIISCTSAIKIDRISFSKNYSRKIETMFKGFFSPSPSKNINQIMFTIRNKTRDTLYLSYGNFKVNMYKNGKILDEDTISQAHYMLYDFIEKYNFLADDLSKLTPEEKVQRIKKSEILKRNFAEKLYKKYEKRQKNNLSKFDKTNFINSVYSYCIVLFPEETISESFLFYSDSLNHNCTSNLTYSDTDTFTTFIGERGVKIKIID